MNSNPSLVEWPLDPIARGGRPLARALQSVVRGVLDSVLAVPHLNALYAESLRRCGSSNFYDAVLAAHGVTVDLAAGSLDHIPREGPLVVVANHPYGAIEGIALLSLVSSLRADVRILANSILHRVPQLREQSFFVDPFGTRESAKANIRGIAGAIRWVEAGGVLVVFPAGEVSHLMLKRRQVADPAWSSTIARIIRKGAAPVVPVYFDGRNRALFQVVGLIHPRLRTLMLPRELVNKRGMTLRVEIGGVIPFARLRGLDSEGMMGYLREMTYLLRARTQSRVRPAVAVRGVPARGVPARGVPARCVPVIEAIPNAIVAREAEGLPASQRLVCHGEFDVFYAGADQIPAVMREIGRLRELTFRAVGEGTGQAIDLDRFDRHYHHLFLWNSEKHEIGGAYRVGRADRIVSWFGIDGLYTRTLFKYDRALLDRMGPALELGRSFVAPDYQKSYNPLMLLWKGIGAYVARNPHYRWLFGPVSISDEYSGMSQQIMSTFLELHTYDNYLGPLVKPMVPQRAERGLCLSLANVIADVEDVGTLMRDVAGEERGMPVLLRQYLRLGGRLLATSVDPAFSSVLDALISVDLAQTERRILERYMGRQGADAFLRHHFVE